MLVLSTMCLNLPSVLRCLFPLGARPLDVQALQEIMRNLAQRSRKYVYMSDFEKRMGKVIPRLVDLNCLKLLITLI